MSPRSTRRAFLAGVTGSSLSLAGCVSQGDTRSPTGPSFDSLVSGVTVGSKHVVVELASSDVEEVVLIAPDGTAFDSQSPAPGVRTVQFTLLDIRSGLNSYKHYSPGEYEIAISTGKAEFTKTLPLQPNTEIVTVEPYRDGDSSLDLAKILVTAENTGSGPTWIHDVSFNEAPNSSLNGDLSANPGIHKLQKPTDAVDTVLAPNQRQTYLSYDVPLLYRPVPDEPCKENTEGLSVRLGTPVGASERVPIEVVTSGETVELSLAGGSVCIEAATSIQQARQ